MRFFLILISVIVTGAALADPPMRTIYSSKSETHFGWSPNHTTQTNTLVQTCPSPLCPGYKANVWYWTPEDVAIYRFHNPQLTYHNQWGYLFPAGTYPVRNYGGVYFVTPPSYYYRAR
jgi:hypothetical protein